MSDSGTSGLVPCYHVTTTTGMVYGVAATTKRDALSFVADRLADDGARDAPRTAERVGTWRAVYGTVLCYGRAA